MRKMIYAISTYDVVIKYPDYIGWIMKIIFPLLKVSVERPRTSGRKISNIYLDEVKE